MINGAQDSFTIFLGKGNGTFEPGRDSGADAGPNFGLARDFNGDHRTDVAIVNLQSSDLSILLRPWTMGHSVSAEKLSDKIRPLRPSRRFALPRRKMKSLDS